MSRDKTASSTDQDSKNMHNHLTSMTVPGRLPQSYMLSQPLPNQTVNIWRYLLWLSTAWLLGAWCCCHVGEVNATPAIKPLDSQQAFMFSAMLTVAHSPSVTAAPARFTLHWQVAPGYYLYQQRLHLAIIAIDQHKLPTPYILPLPPTDQHWHRLAVYQGKYGMSIQLPQRVQHNITLQINYQGCARLGFCYPPMQIIHDEPLVAAHQAQPNHLTPPAPIPTTTVHPPSLTRLLLPLALPQHWYTLLAIIASHLVMGMLLAMTPCILPMLPILMSILLGQTADATTNGAVLRRRFLLALAYVLGSATAYTLAGIVAASSGRLWQVWLQQPSVIIGMSIILCILGISLFGWFSLNLPSRWQQLISRCHPPAGNHIGAFTMGALSILIISPCASPVLIGILLYISQTGNTWLGGSALFTLALGMGIPLLLISLSCTHWLRRSSYWQEFSKKIFGCLLIGMAMYLSVHSIGLSAFTTRWTASTTTSAFKTIEDLPTLLHDLARAKQQQQIVMLDFYADWCNTCKIIEQSLLTKKSIQHALQNVLKLRINLTKLQSTHIQLMRHFGVFAPPTMLFFSAQGNELPIRLIGAINEQQLLSCLTQLQHTDPATSAY